MRLTRSDFDPENEEAGRLPMFILIAIVLLAAAGISFHREPRRLRVGVLLLAALSLLVLAVIGEVFGRTDDPANETAVWILLGIFAVGLLAIVALSLFLIYNGIVMFRRERRSLANRLSLILGGALLGYVVAGFIAIASTDVLLATWLLLTVPPIAWLAFVFCAFLLYAWVYDWYASRFGKPAHIIIVLGAGLIAGHVTPLLASRLARGQKLYEQANAGGVVPRIVVSGGQGSDESVPEGAAMADWLAEHGVSVNDIVPETLSRNTEENLRFSRELFDPGASSGPVVVVTSNYHAFRAATQMRALGIDGRSVGAPTAIYFWPSAMIREFLALLREHFRLNLVALCALSLPVLMFSLYLVAELVT